MQGYLYIMHNPSLPEGLLKIGFSKHLERRRRELSSTEVPDPYTVTACYPVYDMDKAERIVFHHLRHYRYRDKKEFFCIDQNRASATCEAVVQHVNHNTPLALPSLLTDDELDRLTDRWTAPDDLDDIDWDDD